MNLIYNIDKVKKKVLRQYINKNLKREYIRNLNSLINKISSFYKEEK